MVGGNTYTLWSYTFQSAFYFLEFMLIKTSGDLKSFCNWFVILKDILYLDYYMDQCSYLQF